MEPSPKRPRLSIFRQSPDGTELATARYNNDLTLKGRFESIFAKYAKDFTGVGDEINIMTGQVVVNNGHLENMETETDAGVSNFTGNFSSTGRSMLRAMTVAPDSDMSGPDDVLMSIESIAEIVDLSDSDSDDESEDNLFDPSRSTDQSRSKSTTYGLEENRTDTSIQPYNSDTDSLFGEEMMRSDSPDSLFGNGPIEYEASNHSDSQPTNSTEHLEGPEPLMEDKEIIEKFGSDVGKEVLHLIKQRQEAHIEPAWRIPIQIDARPTHSSPQRITTSSSMDKSPGRQQYDSLWKPEKSHMINRNRETPKHDSREESVDPLQEDFPTEFEDDEPQTNAERDALPHSDGESEDELDTELLLESTTTGECPYCYGLYRDKSGVMAHWDRWLRLYGEATNEDDPHDLNLMKAVRSKVKRRIRPPTLILYDFRTMVELHEGAGLSFAEIFASKVLRTRKNSIQLQEIYNKHRSRAWNDFSGRLREWTQAEEQVLQRLCQNPLVTMVTLRRTLTIRSDLEIGNHLAEQWLAKLRTVQATNTRSNQSRNAADIGDPSLTTKHRDQVPSSAQPSFNDFEVKEEDSDDDLFRGS